MSRTQAQFKLCEHRIHIILNRNSRLLTFVEHVKHANME